MSQRPPNILFIFSDQHAQRVAGAYGDAHARTPALDALAADGVTFDNCYTPAPVCGPARMAMLACRPPHGTRVWTNNDILASDIPTYAHALSASGVHTALAGRMHALGPDQNRGFDIRLVGDHSPSWPGAARHDMGVLRKTHGPNRVSLERSGAGNSAYQDLDEAALDAALGQLDAFAKAQQDGENRPFFLQVGFMLPHPPYVARADDFRPFEGRIPPPRQPEAPNDEHPWLNWWRENRKIRDVTPEDRDRARAAYYGLVHRLDRHVARLLERLESLGLTDNTLVAYASDHGDHIGERGLWWKHTFFDESVKVPLILRWPATLPRGARRNQCVDLLDLSATFLAAAAVDPLPNGTGRSLLSIARDNSSEWSDLVFSENCVDSFEGYSGGRSTQQRMLRHGRWKFVYYHGLPSQLFDLQEDPEERHDRAADPSLVKLRAEMEKAVLTGWEPDGIARLMTEKEADKALMRRWAEVTHPPDAIRWDFDPDINTVEAVG